MTSGVEMTGMILTSCQTHSGQCITNVLQPQIALLCHSRSANQILGLGPGGGGQGGGLEWIAV